MPKSELAWTVADYRAAGIEPPARLVTNPDLTEGELMTAEEVEEFVKDSLATLRILVDKQSDRYEQVLETYKFDLAYLVEVGALSEDDYNDLTDESNTRF